MLLLTRAKADTRFENLKTSKRKITKKKSQLINGIKTGTEMAKYPAIASTVI
jgi:hypothetical protein